MIYFSSDLHFGDPRLNLYGRDLIAKNSDEIDELIVANWNSRITANDKVYVLGDVCYDASKVNILSRLNGTKILIKGNYDEQIDDTIWAKYFEKIYPVGVFIKIGDEKVYLNHYPTNGKEDYFNIVGHIHGTWKVQRNMVNVGTDAWHFMPPSLDEIKFQMNGIRKHYDQNVFAGELECNLKYKK